MVAKKPQLMAVTESMIDLADELVAFADDIGEQQDHLLDPDLLRRDIHGYLRLLDDWSRGIGLPEGWVPASQYCYVEDKLKVIGFSSLRHFLTPSLEDLGGHISYVVRPQYRRQGHGTQLLTLTLSKAKELGLDRVLLTTDTHNIGSRKTIELNGGTLNREYLSVTTGTMKARYSIDLTAANEKKL